MWSFATIYLKCADYFHVVGIWFYKCDMSSFFFIKVQHAIGRNNRSFGEPFFLPMGCPGFPINRCPFSPCIINHRRAIDCPVNQNQTTMVRIEDIVFPFQGNRFSIVRNMKKHGRLFVAVCNKNVSIVEKRRVCRFAFTFLRMILNGVVTP